VRFLSSPFKGGDAPTGADTPENAFDELSERVSTLEGELRRDGWGAVTTAVPQTEVVVHGDTGEVWIVHEAPEGQIARIVEAFQDGGFISTCAYQQRSEGRFFELELLLNPGSEHAILLPTVVETEQMPVATVVEEDRMQLYSVITCSTGEQIGAVQRTMPNSLLSDST
jgi:hypothetical protein